MAVEIVSVVEQVGLQDVGENVPDAPVGRPTTEKEADCVVPEVREAVIVFDIEEPDVTDLDPPFDRE